MSLVTKFVSKARTGGNAHVLTIPKALIDSDIVKIGTRYKVLLEEERT